ncbi:MAG: PQQ-binding-like beta-propeller repeat protein [Spirochaetaceae bacterium]|nr:PQQ-binding-like beta-propeller repeat protein [Spirochaetaceae bacterium]MDT8297946.1 PQQ-binding-like beta-propeller repeat protein [Spirochaetaceae bacterium]
MTSAAVPVIRETLKEGLITFLTGEVTLVSDAGERYPEIGDSLTVGDSLVTGADGYAEIQFGDVGAVRIQADTRYRLGTYSLEGDGGQVSGALESGSLVAKIRRLTGDDKFEVNVPGAVCAVRGTQFLVRADEAGSVTVAVSEGTVAIAPPSMAEVGRSGDEIQRIRTVMPLVSRDQEVVLPPDALAEVEKEIVAFAQRGADTDADAAITDLEQRVLAALEKAPVPEKLTEDNAVILEEEEPTLVSFSSSGEDQEIEAPTLVSLTIRTEPSDSRIFINGRSAGIGTTSRVFQEGVIVSLAAVDSNGIRKEQEIVAGSQSTVTIVFEEPEEEAAPIEEPEEEAAQAEQTSVQTVVASPEVNFRITASPSDAVISVSGGASGRGSLVFSVPEGEQITINAERAGYESYQKQIRISPAASPHRVELTPRPIIARTSLSSGPGVGSPAAVENLVIGATGTGALYAVDRSGRILWNLSTKNSKVENAAPVVGGDRGYVIGNAEMVIFDPNSGRILARTDLTGDRADLFGRRPLSLGGYVIVPSDSSLVFVDPASGREEGSIEIPQGSRMSPASWNDKVIIADQRGTLLLIDPDQKTISGKVETGSTQPIGLAPSVSTSGIAVFSGRRGDVSAVDLNGQRVLWERSLSDGTSVGVHTDAVISGETVFILGGDTVYAMSLGSGRDRFAPVGEITAPPMVRDNVLYLCRDDGTLLLHNAVNGDFIGEVRIGERVVARPTGLGPYVVLSGERSVLVVDPRSLTE